MRLFAALPLDEAGKAALARVCATLREQAPGASVTRPELMHLTLAFIGEVDAAGASAAKAALSAVEAPAFTLEVAGIGRFRREDGDILWAGIRPSAGLDELAAKVRAALRGAGLAIDEKPFRPHLTLARRVRFAERGGYEGFAVAHPEGDALCAVPARRFLLMESRRTGGRLEYIERAGFPLN